MSINVKKHCLQQLSNLTEIPFILVSVKEGSLTNKSMTIIIKDTNGKGTYVYGTEFELIKKRR